MPTRPDGGSSAARDAIAWDGMLDRAQVKALPLAGRAAEYVPAAQTCCGVCRTCATTNVLTLAGAAVAAIVARIAGRRHEWSRHSRLPAER